MKKEVLRLSYEKVFENKYLFYISYQDDTILERDKFSDEELKVYSILKPSFNYVKDNDYVKLYIRGSMTTYDKEPFVVSENELNLLLKKVNEINIKYGDIEDGRSKKGGIYYKIDESQEVLDNGFINKYVVSRCIDNYTYIEDYDYKIKNYFLSKEEAFTSLQRIKRNTNKNIKNLLKKE